MMRHLCAVLTCCGTLLMFWGSVEFKKAGLEWVEGNLGFNLNLLDWLCQLLNIIMFRFLHL